MSINYKVILGAILATIVYTGTVFHYGQSYGESTTAEQLASYVAEQQKLASKADNERITAEHALQRANDSYTQKLAELRKDYEDGIVNSNRAHSVRMQQLETRERSYRLMSQATDAERRALADTTAELDRAATEGRYLVGELRRTLALRDEQLIKIGEQILAERKYGK